MMAISFMGCDNGTTNGGGNGGSTFYTWDDSILGTWSGPGTSSDATITFANRADGNGTLTARWVGQTQPTSYYIIGNPAPGVYVIRVDHWTQHENEVAIAVDGTALTMSGWVSPNHSLNGIFTFVE